MLKCLVVILLLFTYTKLLAQPKITQAVQVAQAPRIDGVLDDSAWQNAPEALDFVTNTPVYGKPAAVKTAVRVLYDNNAIYIGAYLYEDPAEIRRQYTPRDNLQKANVDYFSVFLDTYKDRQNAFQFLVTARNVQTDARVSANYTGYEGMYGDASWDAVWESKVGFRPDGWVVEMRIPLFSIRFARKTAADWGIQFMRFSRRLNETSFWNPVNPAMSGFANQFGDITGLNKLLPPLRLSFSPYISGGYRQTPHSNSMQQYETLKSGGMDVKYGINESFTLDATLIPDFGQVVSDNVINNISPFEIRFRENRPFFTEGTELFNKAGIFYSRRIGKTPDKYDTLQDMVNAGRLDGYQLIKNPSVTRLYNAVKFSGRTAGNLGIGVFNGVTENVKATLRNRGTGKDSTVITQPLTNYNIIVFDQALKNRSYITFTNTNVLRNGQERDANVTALDVALYNKANRYGLVVRPRYSLVYDGPGRYNGFANYLETGKVSGNLQFSFSNELRTAQYDPNDLGFQLSPNAFSNTGAVSYNIYQATPSFLNQRYRIAVKRDYLFKPFTYQKTSFEAASSWLFKNFWSLTLTADIAPWWYNDFFEMQTPTSLFQTPRQPLKRSPYYTLFIEGNTDNRKPLIVSWLIGGAEGPLPNDPYYGVQLAVRYRFSDKLILEMSYKRQHDNGQYGYAFVRDPATEAPILARRTYADVTGVFSGVYNFTSRMNLSFRARHYWNRLQNTNLFSIQEDGYWKARYDLMPGKYNINYNAFNLDVFYTWDFRLWSRLIICWKNWLGKDYEYTLSANSYKYYTTNARQLFNTPHGNEFTIRFIYFLNYQQLEKKGKR
jgi:putative ubiquitin-RnfH superfamily antitoxin RatB of RatAB toxin-antitoxin module